MMSKNYLRAQESKDIEFFGKMLLIVNTTKKNFYIMKYLELHCILL